VSTTSKPPRSQADASELMQALIIEIISTFFLLRAAGKHLGAVTLSDGGYWGLLRSLKGEGAQTVPQIARSRPVSRQHIQKLANEMIVEGVIEWVENPAHRRSKLLQLTPKGEIVLQQLNGQIEQEAVLLSENVDVEELQVAVSVLHQLRGKLKTQLRIL
jgi:DNA-binding MarR family transcriptional regulator